MTLGFHLEGEVPPKKNSRINTKSGRSFPNPRFVQWHDAEKIVVNVQWELQAGKLPVTTPCAISVKFTHGDLIARDSDNQLSSILDLLKDVGVIPDDNWKIVRRISVSNLYEKKNANCDITIVSLDDEDPYKS